MPLPEQQPVVSLEQALTELHETRIAEASATITDSTYQLGRIGLIYNGQMTLDFTESESV